MVHRALLLALFSIVGVGDHSLYISCAGPDDAKFTVVFESGGGAFSKDWAAVQGLLAPHLRTCAYDRAGLGQSAPGPAPRTMQQEVFELHVLLESAKVAKPLILVGQSIGALNVRLYAAHYGDEVAGVVLVDPTGENSTLFNVRLNRWIKLREMGSGRVVPPPRLTGPPGAGYKAEDDYLGEEAQLLYLQRKVNPEPFGDRPLFVLAAGKRPPPPGMTEESYRDLRIVKDRERVETAKLSRNAKFVRDPDSGHDIQIDNPKLVAQAVEEVAAAIARNARLTR